MIKLYLIENINDYILSKKILLEEYCDFNFSLEKRIRCFLGDETTRLRTLDLLLSKLIIELSLDSDNKIINIFVFSKEEIKKLVMLLDF